MSGANVLWEMSGYPFGTRSAEHYILSIQKDRVHRNSNLYEGKREGNNTVQVTGKDINRYTTKTRIVLFAGGCVFIYVFVWVRVFPWVYSRVSANSESDDDEQLHDSRRPTTTTIWSLLTGDETELTTFMFCKRFRTWIDPRSATEPSQAGARLTKAASETPGVERLL